jgi:hypothetical protein
MIKAGFDDVYKRFDNVDATFAEVHEKIDKADATLREDVEHDLAP